MKYARWLWHNTRGIRANALLRIAVGLCQVALGLLMVGLSRHFIDVTIRTGSRSDVVLMVGGLLAAAWGAIGLRQIYYYMTAAASVRQTNAIRLRIFAQLFHRQLYTGHDLHSADITSRLQKDIDAVGDATTTMLPQLVVTLCQLVGAFLLMRSMDERLAWLLLVLTPLVVVFGKLLAAKLRALTHDIRQQESRIQMQLQEGMEHSEVLRSLQSGGWLTHRLDMMQRGLQTKVLRRSRFTVVNRLLLAATFSMGYLLAFVWGGLQLRSGAITFGVMTSFLQLVSQIQNPILQILNMLPQLIHTTASIDRLNELETATAEPVAEGSDEPAFLKEEGKALGVRLRDVSFAYPGSDHAVLQHFSHDFRPGSKTAVLGTTGMGKTTLFRLMLGLTRPQAGELSIYRDGQSAPTGTATRRHFVFVPQGNSLLSGSVRYNLLLANPAATDDQLRRALHTAMADFVDHLPAGLDTELGERGLGLSEGQAQRIAIARGLLRPGSILLLDEISSALDDRTEQELFSRLFKAYPEKTFILITHRPHVATLCDDVLRLGNGDASESGSLQA